MNACLLPLLCGIALSGIGVFGIGSTLASVMPVPADYDGDRKVDQAVYRDGLWFILRSSDSGQTRVDWGGLLQDIPVPADYDGDGKADVVVYRDGTWYIIQPSDPACTGCWDY